MDWDSPQIASLVQAALAEDLGGADPRSGDHTSRATVPENAQAHARIIARQEIVLAGGPLAERVFRSLKPAPEIALAAADGARLARGGEIASLRGNARAILAGERTALNFLAHLSGIATLTAQFVQAIDGTRARIRDTRKTTPLYRALEKYAVRCGGGVNHRFGLWDSILIKENHIAAAGGVATAVRRALEYAEKFAAAHSYPEPMAVQVEVRNEAELREALTAGAASLLLDNTMPMQALGLIRIARDLRPNVTIEISGGVKLSNVRAFAEAGADFIAIGAITHSAPAADVSLLFDGAL